MALNTLERDDLLRQIAWLKARTDKIERMLKGEQVGTARIADAAITNAKIDSLEWDKAQGGTATLGGLDNGDGILNVKDESDNQIVTVDKDGILVEGGKILVKNGDDVSIIDETGIISNNVFPVNSAGGAPFTSFTNTSYAVVSGTSTISLTLTRSLKALVLLSIVGSSEQINSSLDCSGRTWYQVYSDIDGELTSFYYDSFIVFATGIRENIISKTYFVSKGLELSPGDHSINVRSKIENNSNFGSVLNIYNLSLILLGS